MGIRAAVRARAQANVSQAQADVVELVAELRRASLLLHGSEGADTMLGSVGQSSLLASVTSALRDGMVAERARLRADVDRLTAELAVADNRLKLARGWQRAVLTVAG